MDGWYFSDSSETLRNGDGRKIAVGVTHKVECEPVLCESGLHASKHVLDALRYANSAILWRVTLSGIIVHGDDKSCATERTYHARLDAFDVLRMFARQCALDVIHLWNAPKIVREFLNSGNENIRIAARDAAWDVARGEAWDPASAAARDAASAAASAAARDAARDAATAAAIAAAIAAARDTAVWDEAKAAAGYTANAVGWDEVRDEVRDAARDPAIAAARAAAWAAAWDRQRKVLDQMVEDALSKDGSSK